MSTLDQMTTNELFVRDYRIRSDEFLQDLIQEYKDTRKSLLSAREQSEDKAERCIISEMISDCEFVIEWLKKGRRPGNIRGIERRAAYQREKLIDPLKLQAFAFKSTAGSASNLSDWEKYQIEDALSILSHRERECYVMAHGECFSFSEIAGFLGISKSSVEKYVERAQKKISHDLNSSLFLVG